jgi:hypothetical protein
VKSVGDDENGRKIHLKRHLNFWRGRRTQVGDVSFRENRLVKENEMAEPTLQDIGDYDRLRGEKKWVVRMVIVVGLLIGAVYTIVANSYVGQPHDALPTNDPIHAMPFDR